MSEEVGATAEEGNECGCEDQKLTTKAQAGLGGEHGFAPVQMVEETAKRT
jgi:hypothetical protein